MVDRVAIVAAPVGSSNRAKILLPIVLGGGFFVLFFFVALTAYVPLLAVPNDALAVVVLPAHSSARVLLAKTMPALLPLEALAPYNTALVVLSNPLAVGTIVYVPKPEDLLALSQTNLSYIPIWNRLVVVGDQNFVDRIVKAQKLPWWIRLRTELTIKKHAAALLVAPTQEAPWLLGSLDQKNEALALLLPVPSAPHETNRLIESDLQSTLADLARLLLPVSSSIRLPDNSIVQELREDASALSWEIEEKNGPTYTLLQNNKPVLFYERLREKSDCSDKNTLWGVDIGTYPPLPELKLEISLLNRAILFCIFNGDKL